MKNFRLLATDLPVAPLLERLREKEVLWAGLGARLRQQYAGSAHAQAEAVLLRWPAEMSVEAAFADLEAIDQPEAIALCPELAAVTTNLVLRVGTSYVGRCLITRLAPGARIPPHIDEGRYADIFDRFHVCLAGGPGNTFRCGAERLHPEPGQAFWFNRKLEHEVEAGDTERLHLILDLEAPQYQALRGTYIQNEPLEDAWPDMLELFAEHYQEIARYQDIALEPDEEAYQRIADRGALRIYTVRAAGALVGYAMFIVGPNPHYKSSITAIQDVLYLHPEHRRGMTGVRLLRHAERRLRAEGVQVVYHHVKRTTRVGELLGRLGYELVDHLYAKRLDKE